MDGGLGQALVYVGAFAAACLFDLVSATLREAAAMDVPPRVQIGVLARVWVVDACLAPVGLLAAQSALDAPVRVLLVLPLGVLLLMLARDRSARIAQAHRRLEQVAHRPAHPARQPPPARGRPRANARRGHRRRSPLVLVLFDLDGFKSYNDTFGHLAGDALLARLGAKLAAAVEPARRGLPARRRRVLRAARRRGERPRRRSSPRPPRRSTSAARTSRSRASYGVVLLPHEADEPRLRDPARRRAHVRAASAGASPARATRRATC